MKIFPQVEKVVITLLFILCFHPVASGAVTLLSPAGITEIEISEVSALPDPETNPYNDCLLVTRARIVSGDGSDGEPQILAVFWGFRDRVLSGAAALKPGMRVEVELVPFEEAPEDIQQTQMADDFNDFSTPIYYAILKGESEIIHEKPDTQDAVVELVPGGDSDRTTTQADRQSSIDADKAVINELLNKHGGDWEKWFDELGEFRNRIKHLVTNNYGLIKDDFYFGKPEALFIRFDGKKLEEKSSVKALIALNKWLGDHGIDLIVVPVPVKEIVTARVFFPELAPDCIYQPYRLRMFLYLLEHDVEIIDLAPALCAELDNPKLLFYPNSDDHPSDRVIQLSARLICDRLQRYDFIREAELQGGLYSTNKVTTQVPESLTKWPFKRPYSATDIIPATQVIDGEGNVLQPVKASPIFMFGDSFLRSGIAHGSDGADLWAHIALRTNVIPVTQSQSAGATKVQATILRNEKKILKNCKVVVLYFMETYLLYNADWVNVMNN